MAEMKDVMVGYAAQVFFGSVLLFGFYIGMFFLLSQAAPVELDINTFLDDYGLAFVAATVLYQVIEVGIQYLRG